MLKQQPLQYRANTASQLAGKGKVEHDGQMEKNRDLILCMWWRKCLGLFLLGYFWMSRILLRAAEAEKSARGEIGAVPAVFQRS